MNGARAALIAPAPPNTLQIASTIQLTFLVQQSSRGRYKALFPLPNGQKPPEAEGETMQEALAALFELLAKSTREHECNYGTVGIAKA